MMVEQMAESRAVMMVASRAVLMVEQMAASRAVMMAASKVVRKVI